MTSSSKLSGTAGSADCEEALLGDERASKISSLLSGCENVSLPPLPRTVTSTKNATEPPCSEGIGSISGQCTVRLKLSTNLQPFFGHMVGRNAQNG